MSKSDNYQRGVRKKVVVFGANGFLGSTLVKKLSKSGFEIIGFVRPGSNRFSVGNIESVKILEMEVSEWPELLLQINPHAVVCAQWNGVSKADRNNIEKQISNLQPIISLAKIAQQTSTKTFICFGSQAECRENNEIIPELFSDSSESAYGTTKAKLSLELKKIFENSDCRFVWARIFSVYGPSDFSESLFSQLFKCQTSGKELEILTPSKSWSYLYEDDFAAAIEQILENANLSGVVNVGNPRLIKIRTVVEAWGGSLNIKFKEDDRNKLKVGFYPEIKKLSDIKWRPKISIEEGVQITKKSLQERFSQA